MRMKYKVIFLICFLMVVFSVFGIASNAATYEPDGSSSTVYECNKSDANRTLVVKCVDEKGNLIKKVTFKCEYGEEGLVDLGVYGYDIVAFESNQGLLETCKLTWCSGTDLCTHAYIQIKYNFRTSLSKEKITATVTLRRSEEIKLITRYYVQKIDLTNTSKQSYELHSSVTKTVDYYDEVSTSAKTITGYKLKEGYESKIAGNLSYTWVGKYKNTPSKPRTYDYDFISTDTSDDMDEWTSYDEDRQGKLSYCINRVYYIDYYYDLEQYTIYYNANGGSGAPSSQVKYYNKA